jgi:ACS family glucarate transporter-like MFS transporter
MPFICMTIGSLLGGALSDRLTRLKGLRVGRCFLASSAFAVAAPLLILGSHVGSPKLAAIYLACAAGAMYFAQSTFWTVSVDIAGRSSGVFSSMVNMTGQIGGAITASLTPWLAQHFGWTTAYDVAAGLAIFGALCWLTVHPERSLDESNA